VEAKHFKTRSWQKLARLAPKTTKKYPEIVNISLNIASVTLNSQKGLLKRNLKRILLKQP